MVNAPSDWQIQQALSVALAMKERLLQDDPDIADDTALLHDTLDGATDVYDVLRYLGRWVLDAEAMVDAAKARAADLATRQARFEARAQAGRGAMFAMMDALERRRFDDPEFTLTIRAGSRSVQIVDEAELPNEYWRVSRAPDKAAIGTALKAGADVPGAMLSNSIPTLALKAT